MGWFEDEVVPNLKEGINVEVLKAKYGTEVQTRAMAEVPGVLANKEEILNEKKEIQKQFSEFKEKYSSFEDGEVTFETFTQLKNDYEALKASSGGGDLTEEMRTELYNNGKKAIEEQLNPKLLKMETDYAVLQGSLKEANSKYLDFRARNEIMQAVDEANIDSDPIWLEGLIRQSEISYNDQEDKLSIMVPHDGGSLPLSDWKNVYPQTEVGKKRVKAPMNNGGGANGGRGTPGVVMALADIAKIEDMAERQAAYTEAGY